MKRLYQIGNILTLVFALVMNYLVGAQVLNVPSIGEMSDKYATLLTPATYAFSIWSLIYVLLIGFVVYQARDLFRPREENDVPIKVGPFFMIASIMNGLWTYIFVKDWIALSVIVLATLVISLYAVLYRLNIALDTPSLKTAMFVWWPLLIYAGWVTVAFVVNIASWLQSMDVVLSPVATSLILLVLLLGLLYLLVKRNVRELLLASAWGIAAIGIMQSQASDGNALVTGVAFSVAGTLILATAIHAAYQLHAGRKLMVIKSRHVAKN